MTEATPVNPERGEVEIVLDGTAYPLRPTWRAAVAIEQRLTQLAIRDGLDMLPGSRIALSSIMIRCADKRLGLSLEEMAVIVTEGIRAFAIENKKELLQKVTEERVGELVFKSGGFFVLAAPLSAFVSNLLTGGAQPKKDVARVEGSAQTDRAAMPSESTTAS